MPFGRVLIFFLLSLFVLSCQSGIVADAGEVQKQPLKSLKYCDCHYEYISRLKKSFQKGNKLINWKYVLSQPPENNVPSPYHDVCILIDTFNLTLSVFSDKKLIRKYPVAVGKPQYETPVGTWKVVEKSAYYAPGMGSRWMRLNIYSGVYGIHGTDNPWSIGTYASHGCVRMHNAHVEEIYSWVTEGAPVIIVGNPFYNQAGEYYYTFQKGACGLAVYEAQRILRRLGYTQAAPDGIFGPKTEKALIAFRRKNGLSAEGIIDGEVYRLLGW
ncbi:MAG TPA: hypothetical protein DD719_04195 [Desulfotomaculum sp.]|nr:hypothetical protein [Desulfotomaculum sp.]HCJ79184.1 hypothetical protein [Desulfotomaculum sp.]